MKKAKLEKGITLVALIITIVVLLILAVVSIGAIRDSKIIGHATNISGNYEIAKEEENNILIQYEKIIEEQTKKTIVFYVDSYGDIEEYQVKEGTTWGDFLNNQSELKWYSDGDSGMVIILPAGQMISLNFHDYTNYICINDEIKPIVYYIFNIAEG